jgi:predicted dehydrogenase
LKVGVIGAGAWGKNIVRTLAEMDALAGVAEADGALREEIHRRHPDAEVFDSADALLATDVPAVAIATHAPSHFELAHAALLEDKDVFVEKPLTLSGEQAQQLVELAEARDRVLMVGHLLMYQPAVQWIKTQIEAGLVGKLRSLHQERLNLGRARAVENVLWSLGVHDVAVLLFLVGEDPSEVVAAGDRILQQGIEDDVYLHLTFPGGVKAHLHNSWLWPERRRRLTVIGERGMLVYDELEQTVTLHRKRIDERLQNVDEGSELAFEGAGEPLRIELEHFLTCVRERRAPISSGRSAIPVVRVLECAFPGAR